jgi:serine/threonine protein kinase
MNDRQQRVPEPRSQAFEITIGGKYRIEALLGEGGFARVYRARHARIRQMVFAIKVLRQQQVQDPAQLERFVREAEMSATLQSPFVVRVSDFGETRQGLPYIVMEYVKGRTLYDWMQKHGAVPEAYAARIAWCILKALDEAHNRGIVHRDLKPSNIMLLDEPADGGVVAKVTDFGIAKVIDSTSSGLSESPPTTGGLVFCTPQYASPEVLIGSPTFQSDVYALGHTLGEMLDGKSPFVGWGSFEIANRQMSAEPTPWGSITRHSVLFHVIQRACAKETRERYTSAAEMLRDLEPILAALESTPASAEPSAPMRRVLVEDDEPDFKEELTLDDALLTDDLADTIRTPDDTAVDNGPTIAVAAGRHTPLEAPVSGVAAPLNPPASPPSGSSEIRIGAGFTPPQAPSVPDTNPATLAMGTGRQEDEPVSFETEADLAAIGLDSPRRLPQTTLQPTMGAVPLLLRPETETAPILRAVPPAEPTWDVRRWSVAAVGVLVMVGLAFWVISQWTTDADSAPPVTPVEDESLRQELAALADRMAQMEQERLTSEWSLARQQAEVRVARALLEAEPHSGEAQQQAVDMARFEVVEAVSLGILAAAEAVRQDQEIAAAAVVRRQVRRPSNPSRDTTANLQVASPEVVAPPAAPERLVEPVVIPGPASTPSEPEQPDQQPRRRRNGIPFVLE